MKSKHSLIFVLAVIFQGGSLFAQTDSISKWSFSANILPHLKSGYYYGFTQPEKGLGISAYALLYPPIKIPLPAVDFKAEYALFKKVSLQAGIGYVRYNTQIKKYNIYLRDAEGGRLLIDGTENATIHILELPASVNYYFANNEFFKAFVCAGDVSSFIMDETNAGDFGTGPNKVHTTIYQNYLQLALGIEMKTRHTWDWYFSPTYRIAMVNYYDQIHYNIYAFPNVFYERMLGLEIGMKFNKLKKKILK